MPRCALRAIRAAVVRLVPLPGTRSDRRAGHLALDRAHPSAQHYAAGQRRGRVPARVAASAHQARMARPEGAHAGEIRSRGALRSQREDAAVVADHDQAPRSHRRKAFRRHRTDHAAPARGARRIRRPVHPRDHLDRQPHLPLRPPRLAGGHAGHRRPDLDDPLHQQGLPDGAFGLQPGGDAADHDADRKQRRSAEGDG